VIDDLLRDVRYLNLTFVSFVSFVVISTRPTNICESL